MARFIAVMGPGRCGSSAVAGVLHVAGIPMGERLIGAHWRWNAKGHFEEREFHYLNRLAGFRLVGHPVVRNEALAQYPQIGTMGDLSPEDVLHRYALTVERYTKEPVWGLKCILFGAIWPHVKHLFGDDRRVVVVHRAWPAMVQSRMAHGEHTQEEAETICTYLSERITEAVRRDGAPVLHVTYDRLLHSPEKEVTRLLDFAGEGLSLDLDYAAATAHIDPGMDHYG